MDRGLAVHRRRADRPRQRLLHTVHLLQRVHVHSDGDDRILRTGVSNDRAIRKVRTRVESPSVNPCSFFSHKFRFPSRVSLTPSNFCWVCPPSLPVVSELNYVFLFQGLVGDCEEAEGVGSPSGRRQEQQEVRLEVRERRLRFLTRARSREKEEEEERKKEREKLWSSSACFLHIFEKKKS